MKRTLFLRTVGSILAIVVLATGLFIIFTLALVREASRHGAHDRLEGIARVAQAAVTVPAATGDLAAVRECTPGHA
mgnify:CR=1 FL=1